MTTLLKHLLDAGDARAAADSLVGLKSGKVQVICQGWPHETVRDRRDRRPSPSHRASHRVDHSHARRFGFIRTHIPFASRTTAGAAYLA